jgi:hypothetical protein
MPTSPDGGTYAVGLAASPLKARVLLKTLTNSYSGSQITLLFLDMLQSLVRVELTMVGAAHICVFCLRQNPSTDVLVRLASDSRLITKHAQAVR